MVTEETRRSLQNTHQYSAFLPACGKLADSKGTGGEKRMGRRDPLRRDYRIQRPSEKHSDFEEVWHWVGLALGKPSSSREVEVLMLDCLPWVYATWPEEPVRHVFYGASSWNLVQRVNTDCTPRPVFPHRLALSV